MHITRTIKAAAMVAATALVTACTVPSSPTAGPGPQQATAAQAAQLFASVCVGNRPSLTRATETLATLPVTYNSTNEIYFHNQLDLSFKFFPRGSTTLCSMVWGSNQSVAANRGAILGAAPDANFSAPDSNSRLFAAGLLGGR